MKHKTLKSTLIFVTATLLIAGSAIAQQEKGGRDGKERHHGPRDAETKVAHMTRQLDLSDEQSAQLLQVMQAAEVEREALHQMIMEQMKPEICGLQVGTEAEIKSILTQDQLASMEALKQERGGKRGGKPGRGMADLDCSAYE